MILSLPFPYGCQVAHRDGTRGPARQSGRTEVGIGRLDERDAPVALRWGPRDASPEGWAHTRWGAGTHLRPVGAPGEDPRVACARAVLEGWDGIDLPPPPQGPHHVPGDPWAGTVLGDDRAAREAGIRARAAQVRLVGGRAYVPCPEPVAVEVGPGLAEIRVGRGVDWLSAHSLRDLGPAGPRLAQGCEVLLPSALALDREGLAQRVVRKALIVLRKACESNLDARRRAAEAEASLSVGQPRLAAEAMAGCLASLSASAQGHAGLREFIARTGTYLGGYLAA